jgi:triphosphoribosyl-dephospho-CoA synthase
MDVAGAPPADLLSAMRAASTRDLVARQYVENFAQVLNLVVPWLYEGQRAGWRLTDSIVHAHVRLMSQFPDSLIARKCGPDVARRSADLAAAVLAAGRVGDENYERGLAELDFWLRSDGRRRNPGTTADLLAAGLFVVLREQMIDAWAR